MKIKKKLRDITVEEYKDWYMKNCYCSDGSCNTCPFESVNCSCSTSKINWINNKDLYSDKFLNKKIEIDGPDILDKKEKEYLESVIKPFKNNVQYIIKQSALNGQDNSEYEYITIFINTTTNIGWVGQEYIAFPYFKKATMYTNMIVNKRYTLEELGLFLKEE